MRRTRSGFTLIELLVVLGIGLLLLAIVIPYAISLREQASRTACANNLSQLYTALTAYHTANGRYPMTPQDADHLAGYTAFTGADDSNPFAPASAVKKNDVTACLWLLVRGGYLRDTFVFICPSTSDFADGLVDAQGHTVAATNRGNFRSTRNLSYAMASPYSAVEGYPWNDALPAERALMADRGPGKAAAETAASAGPVAMSWANSPNHRGVGQNVLYAYGGVRFETNPYTGIGFKADDLSKPGDNIYTALRDRPIPSPENPPADGNGVVGQNVGPAWWNDSYLVPPRGE